MNIVRIKLYGEKAEMSVDSDFYESKLRGRSVWLNNHGYAHTAIDGVKNIPVHRLVMGASPGQIVDHIDRDRLNNARSNLRIVTVSQNNANRRPVNNRTGLKGVAKGYGNKWNAYIKKHGKPTCLGTFVTKEDAARAYDIAARELYGEFAYQNFPQLT